MGKATSPRATAVVDDDERFVQLVEQYDEYLADQQHAIELLKQVRGGVITEPPLMGCATDCEDMNICRDSSSSRWPR
jgi:hypothetical protein